MAEGIRFCYTGGQGEIVEKKSRFIATVSPVTSEDEANEFISRIKKQYWDARHNCSAFVIGDDGQLTRCSDDGEPPHTAGRPMLDLLLKEDLRNICVVVTRYFGGTLLGTGGLIRAYQASAKAGLEASEIVTKMPGIPLTITTDYNGIGRLQYLAAELDCPILDTLYTDIVVCKLLCPPASLSSFESKLALNTAGQARLEAGDPCHYLIRCGHVEIL